MLWKDPAKKRMQKQALWLADNHLGKGLFFGLDILASFRRLPWPVLFYRGNMVLVDVIWGNPPQCKNRRQRCLPTRCGCSINL